MIVAYCLEFGFECFYTNSNFIKCIIPTTIRFFPTFWILLLQYYLKNLISNLKRCFQCHFLQKILNLFFSTRINTKLFIGTEKTTHFLEISVYNLFQPRPYSVRHNVSDFIWFTHRQISFLHMTFLLVSCWLQAEVPKAFSRHLSEG